MPACPYPVLQPCLQIAKLTAIRIELDCRVNILTSERNTHVCSLEDAHDRIVALEQHSQEQQEQVMPPHAGGLVSVLVLVLQTP